MVVAHDVLVRTIRTKAHKYLVRRLREERLARKLHQADVAKRLRQSQTWVAYLEGGQRRIDVIEFLAIAKAIGFDAVKMLRELRKIGENNTK